MTERDLRPELYAKYVSTFKGVSSEQVDLKTPLNVLNWPWCESKYLPLLASVGHDEEILELGCGSGWLIELLRSKGFSRVQGVDLSQEQVSIARVRGTDVVRSDAIEFLAGTSDRYGAIIALDFIEHFQKGELLTLFAAIHKALKPGGTLLLQTPNGQGLFAHQIIYDDLTHSVVFSPRSLAQVLEISGFKNISFIEAGPAPTNVRAAIRFLLWKGIRLAAKIAKQIETGKRQEIWTENFVCRSAK